MNFLNSGVESAQIVPRDYVPPTITQRLRDRKQSLEMDLARIDNALKILEKNPEVQNVIDVLSKLNF